MKKIFSFFAAMLVAFVANAKINDFYPGSITVESNAVVLPATLDVTNVSFRSEGMPDYVIAEGDYAGTYFDMGAHDSSNDTLLYAEWDVTIEPIMYNIAVDVYNTNSWRVQLYLLNQAGDTLKDLRYKGSSGQSGHFAIGSIDMRDLEAGDYKLRARAATAWSQMKLKDVIFEADYSGVNVELPGTLLPAYAELFGNASVVNNAINFKPSTANTDYATWNVNFAAAGNYTVSIDITASNGHNYGVALITTEGEIAVNEGGQKSDTGVKELGVISVPAAGNYVVKLTNATQWSEAVLNSITFVAPYEPNMKTIYCKMEHSWWTADGAAIGLYTWDDNGNQKVAWPGERMTLVDGETDVWSFELDVNTYHMCIFTRMNPVDGDNQDWGAKTTDQTIPADDNNLFTITNATESWGDPGCNGVWSVYGAEPEAPAKFYITGNAEALGNWNPAAIKSTEDAYVLHLEAGAYKMKVTVDGTWDTAKGIEDLTERAAGLQDINGNIGFILAEAGDVTVTYTSEVFKVEGAFVNTPIVKLYFATGEGWAEDAASTAVYDADNEKINVTLVQGKQSQWQAQVWYKTTVAQANKLYDVSLKIKANQTFGGVIAKWQNAQMIFSEEGINLTANQEYVLTKTDLAGKDGGDGMLIFDFGFAPANTTVEIYDIVIAEKEAPVVPELADGFYLIGRIAGVDGWDATGLVAEHKFGPNLENPVEFMLNVTLEVGDEIQVVNVLNNAITAWFPGGEGNNYVIDAAHAGEKTVYFRPDNQGGEGWHHGCIYIAPNEETGLNNIEAVKAVKMMENGQLVIIKNGVKYNALGAELR